MHMNEISRRQQHAQLSRKSTQPLQHDDDNGNHCRSIDPILTLTVPLDIGNGSSPCSAADSPKGRYSISSLCFLTPASTAEDFAWGGMGSNGNNYQHKTGDAFDNNEDSSSCSSSSSSSDEDEDEEFGLNLRCSKLLQGERRHDEDPSSGAREAATALSLASTLMASCHTNGEVLIWNLGQRRVVHNLAVAGSTKRQSSDGKHFNRGPGLVLRRLDDKGYLQQETRRLLYQTRDPKGIVSIHDVEHPGASLLSNVIQCYETFSQTFCAATPCSGNPNLLALPAERDDIVTVRDIRCDPLTSHPVAKFNATLGSFSGANIGKNDEEELFSYPAQKKKHGMLTSLAMSESTPQVSGGIRPIVACGMESGTLFFHDLAMLRSNEKEMKNYGSTTLETNTNNRAKSDFAARTWEKYICDVHLSKDPILALDMFPSLLPATSGAEGSVVAIAGMAGESLELADLAEADRGTVALLKATIHQPTEGENHKSSTIGGLEASSQDTPTTDFGSAAAALMNRTVRVRIRARLGTCKLAGNGDGKPGVSVCRFRPDGRIFAVGGWDKRLRIFDRVGTSDTNTLLAILRGHTDSVNAVDWAPDADKSGILATAAPDGLIYIWRCFS